MHLFVQQSRTTLHAGQAPSDATHTLLHMSVCVLSLVVLLHVVAVSAKLHSQLRTVTSAARAGVALP
jgi:hypothetical protein